MNTAGWLGYCRVRLISTSNLTPSGLQDVDGVAAVAGDHVLLTAQSTASQNGWWIVRVGQWEQKTGYFSGMVFTCSEGVANANKEFILQTADPITFGTTSLTIVEFGAGGVPTTRTLTAGAGLTGGGDLSADRTFNVVANADASIVVNANDVQVGVLATDAQHGVRGGGTQHANVVAGGAAGFMSGTDKTKLDGLPSSAVPTTRTLTAGSGLAGGGDLSADRTFDVSVTAPIQLVGDSVAFDTSAALNNNARVTVRKNTGADVGTRRRLNFIEGTNVTLTVTDDAGSEEVDVTIAASGGGAPADAGYIVDALHAGLSNERAATDTATVAWDFGTVGQAKANVPDDSITYAKIQNVTDARLLGRSAGAAGDVQEITVGSPVTLSGGALDFDESVALGNVARTTVRKNTGADVGSRRRLNFIEGTNVTLTVTDDAGSEEVDITIAASGGPGGGAAGLSSVEFGAADNDVATVAVADASIAGTSVVHVLVDAANPTADHSADELMTMELQAFARDIVAGVGFTAVVVGAKVRGRVPIAWTRV